MELTSAEDIHLICLFEELEEAMRFDALVRTRRVLIRNREDIFGEQLLTDGEDRVIGKEEYLLSNATDISIEEAVPLAEAFGGICYPAHIDRQSNGMLSVLGAFPPSPFFACAEVHDPARIGSLSEDPVIAQKRILVSSDAHFLWDVKEKREYFELDDEPYSGALVRKNLFTLLRKGI